MEFIRKLPWQQLHLGRGDGENMKLLVVEALQVQLGVGGLDENTRDFLHAEPALLHAERGLPDTFVIVRVFCIPHGAGSSDKPRNHSAGEAGMAKALSTSPVWVVAAREWYFQKAQEHKPC